MPTVKLDINTGLEYSPTDGLDSLVKLHNFTVGTDGSIYKLPALKNLKNTLVQEIDIEESDEKKLQRPGRLLDIRKFQSSATEISVIKEGFTPKDYFFKEYNLFRRLIYLTDWSYGVINVNYEKSVVTNDEIKNQNAGISPDENVKKFGNFEYTVLNILPDKNKPKFFDLSSNSPEIIVDFNKHNSKDGFENPRAVFPAPYMWYSKDSSNGKYELLMEPANMVTCSIEAVDKNDGHDHDLANADVNPLSLDTKGKDERKKNDLAKGAVLIGNRMVFYSEVDNALFISKANDFSNLMKDPNSGSAYQIVPPEEIQGITEFNGNLIVFTPTGMDRWVFNENSEQRILINDPTFKYSFRLRCCGSWVKSNKDLYFYTDQFGVYVLKNDLSVENVFPGILPSYEPFSEIFDSGSGKDYVLEMVHFKMLGYRFVSVGPWLYNIDSKTWSTYTYDGWKLPEKDYNPDLKPYLWENDLAKRVIQVGSDDIICTYSTICIPLTYKEMQDQIQDSDVPTLEEGKFQWGETAFFSTRMYQQENTFSVDGVLVYVRGGTLQKGDKMWLRILKGRDQGEIDVDDESTWGIPASYEPLQANALGSSNDAHIGQFQWRTNVKCERFRLQVVTNSKRGVVVQSVLANISLMGERGQQGQQPQAAQKQ